jgi:hypothetical protein
MLFLVNFFLILQNGCFKALPLSLKGLEIAILFSFSIISLNASYSSDIGLHILSHLQPVIHTILPEMLSTYSHPLSSCP